MFCDHWDNFITFISNFSITVEFQRHELCNAAEEKMLLEQLMWDDVGFEGFPRGTVPIPRTKSGSKKVAENQKIFPYFFHSNPKKQVLKAI